MNVGNLAPSPDHPAHHYTDYAIVAHRHKWKDNIKIDLKEIRWRAWTALKLVHYREKWQAVVNAVTHSIN
jgi:hypothetical protein